MFGWIVIGDVLFAVAGVLGGVYLACRFEWPQRCYDWIFGARR